MLVRPQRLAPNYRATSNFLLLRGYHEHEAVLYVYDRRFPFLTEIVSLSEINRTPE